jgi:hypothetical protein
MRLAVLCAGLILSACEASEGPQLDLAEQEYSAAQFKEALPGITDACIKRLQAKKIRQSDERLHVDATPPVPTDRCFQMQEPRKWRGLWRNVFEGSRFCPEPARECGHNSSGEDVWLEFAEGLPEGKIEASGGLYAMEFVGRRTSRPGRHGHFGMSDHAIVVDRVISMKQVEPPTKRRKE